MSSLLLPSSSSTHPLFPGSRSRHRLGSAGAAALLLAASALSAGPAHAAIPPSTGQATSVTYTAGKGQGSGHWGTVGDIETVGSGGPTFTYGLAFDASSSTLWVTDSGKVLYSRFGCLLAGHSGSSCQLGTPRTFVYHRTQADDSTGDYTVDGAYTVDGMGDPTRNDGIGARFESVADRTVLIAPYAATGENVGNGPRGVDVAADGTAWVVNSEKVAPLGGPAGVVDRFAPDATHIGGSGWSAAWADRDQPGVHFYRTGVAATPQGTVLVTSEVSDRLQEYAADGTWIRSIKLDVPPGTYSAGDRGFRSPYGISVDPTDGSMYIAYTIFRDEAALKATPFIEKRDKDGALLATFGTAQLKPGEVVFGTAVNPTNHHVYGWNESGAVHEWTADGTFVRSFSAGTAPGTFPGLTAIRDVEFDETGRMYVSVAQGTASTRIMILAQTPGPVTSTCSTLSADRTSVALGWDCDPAKKPTTATVPVHDYVVEQSVDGGTTWTVVPHAAASTETSRTITGLDPSIDHRFRVSAWNEAGNGDWAEFAPAAPVTVVDDAGQADYGQPVTVDVLANDASATAAPLDAGSLTLLDASGAPTSSIDVSGEGRYEVTGGKIRFTPAADFSGTARAVPYSVYGDCVIATASVSATIAAKPVPTPTPTPTPTAAPTQTAVPTTAPTAGPTAEPTASPTSDSGSASPAPGTSAAASPSASAAAPQGRLARTGADFPWVGLIASIALIGAGALFLAWRRLRAQD